MSELSDNAQLVRRSLEQRPTLNTPALIVEGEVVDNAIARDDVEAALDELIAAGLVKHRPTGWKLA